MKHCKAHLFTSEAPVKWNTRYKQGGTTIITTASIIHQIKEKNDNPLGLCSTITIGPPTLDIKIIIEYIVFNTQISANKDKTAVYQQ